MVENAVVHADFEAALRAEQGKLADALRRTTVFARLQAVRRVIDLYRRATDRAAPRRPTTVAVPDPPHVRAVAAVRAALIAETGATPQRAAAAAAPG
jgi:hypothetical protein